jgi:hypothetical protein
MIHALRRIVVDRDFSISATDALESEISTKANETQAFEELSRILASYRPGGGDLYLDENALEFECKRVLESLETLGGS